MAEQQEVIAKGEETIIALTSRDAEDVYQKLRPARDHSYEIGLKLRLSHDSVEEIYLTHKEPSQRLREVIKRALNLTSSLTWRAISDVLRNHPINLPDLANNIEATRLHRGEASISHTVVVEGRSVQPAETQQQDSTVLHEVKLMIQDLQGKFQRLKNDVKKNLQKHKIPVIDVADALVSLSPDDDDNHKIFMESHVGVLFGAGDYSELFGTMNFHWNYLDPSCLNNLVRKFNLEELKDRTKRYNLDVQQFRTKTPLPVFVRMQRRKRFHITREFEAVVAAAEFNFQEDVTLEVVEQFRQEYVSHYNLRECAMMIAEVYSR